MIKDYIEGQLLTKHANFTANSSLQERKKERGYYVYVKYSRIVFSRDVYASYAISFVHGVNILTFTSSLEL